MRLIVPSGAMPSVASHEDGTPSLATSMGPPSGVPRSRRSIVHVARTLVKGAQGLGDPVGRNGGVARRPGLLSRRSRTSGKHPPHGGCAPAGGWGPGAGSTLPGMRQARRTAGRKLPPPGSWWGLNGRPRLVASAGAGSSPRGLRGNGAKVAKNSSTNLDSRSTNLPEVLTAGL